MANYMKVVVPCALALLFAGAQAAEATVINLTCVETQERLVGANGDIQAIDCSSSEATCDPAFHLAVDLARRRVLFGEWRPAEIGSTTVSWGYANSVWSLDRYTLTGEMQNFSSVTPRVGAATFQCQELQRRF